MDKQITLVDIIELAQAVLKGSMIRTKDKYWSNGGYHDADVCCYCGFYRTVNRPDDTHEPGCPSIKAKDIINTSINQAHATVTRQPKPKNRRNQMPWHVSIPGKTL